MQAEPQRSLPSISVVTTYTPRPLPEAQPITLLAARAVMDRSTDHIAILDEEGTIIDVNHEWRDFAAKNSGVPDKTAIGVNYLKTCVHASKRADEQARLFAEGLCSVMDGERDEFELDSLCLVENEMHVFRGRVERLVASSRNYYMVSHRDLNAGDPRRSA